MKSLDLTLRGKESSKSHGFSAQAWQDTSGYNGRAENKWRSGVGAGGSSVSPKAEGERGQVKAYWTVLMLESPWSVLVAAGSWA